MTSQKLALAFDQNSKESFLESLTNFNDLPIVVKLGIRLLPLLQREDFTRIKKMGFEIFIDAKVHDIPTQVRDAVRTWADLGADYLTVHLSGGRQMLSEAQEATNSTQTKILGVSVLTSLGKQDFKELGWSQKIDTQVETLIGLGRECGLKYFVCSGQELKTIKSKFKESLFVCPGIHLDKGNPSGDQQRSVTFSEVLACGPFMPVIGRALFQSPNPRDLCIQLLKQMGIYS